MKRGQVWALDSIIAAVIFVSAISAFIVLITANITSNSEYLKDEARVVPQILLSSNSSELSIVQGNKIDLTRIKQAQTYDYDELRSLFGIRGQFCIYFEDKDGKLVNLSDFTGIGDDVGLGSDEVILYEGGGKTIYCTK